MRQSGIGDVVAGRYRLVREVGRGAAGVVFEALQTFTGRRVAIKLVAADAEADDRRELEERLLREARALGSVQHPGVVDVIDAGLDADDSPFLVMELLQGRTLEGILAARRRLDVNDAIALGVQLCDALSALHARQIVHRDVKPGNIYLVRDDDGSTRSKLVDLGIASRDDATERRLTARGMFVGTVEYMPVERLAGEQADSRTDVYSVGITLFECLAGEVPTRASRHATGVHAVHIEPDVPRARIAGVPEALIEVIGRACARKRDDRYRSIAAFGDALRVLAEPQVPRLGILDDSIASAQARDTTQASRRRFARAPFYTPVRIETVGEHIDGRSEDISAGGMFVLAWNPPEVREEVKIRFALPVEGVVVATPGVIRWVKRPSVENGPSAIGIEFTNMDARTRNSIERYVALMGQS